MESTIDLISSRTGPKWFTSNINGAIGPICDTIKSTVAATCWCLFDWVHFFKLFLCLVNFFAPIDSFVLVFMELVWLFHVLGSRWQGEQGNIEVGHTFIALLTLIVLGEGGHDKPCENVKSDTA